MSYLGLNYKILTTEKDKATDIINLNFNLSNSSVPYSQDYGIDLTLTGSTSEDIKTEIKDRVNIVLRRSGYYKLDSVDLNKKVIRLTNSDDELEINLDG